MAETTADVRRDIELTRERMSTTLSQLEHKLNVMQIVRDNPWPALALAVGAGVLLSGSHADVKAAAATVTATKGASGRLGSVLDDVVANLMTGVTDVFHGHVDRLVTELKNSIGAPTSGSSAGTANRGTAARSSASPFASNPGASGSSAGAGPAGSSGASWSPQSASGEIRDGIGSEISHGRSEGRSGGMQAGGVEWQPGRAD